MRRVSYSTVQISILTAELKSWASSRNFHESLSVMYTIANKMGAKITSRSAASDICLHPHRFYEGPKAL